MTAITFLSPWILVGLAALPIIWWLLRTTPPPPQRIRFPALRLLRGLRSDQQTPARSPWWLTLIRMLAATAVIFAIAEPVLDPEVATVTGKGPVVVAIDNGWAAAAHWRDRQDMLDLIVDEAEQQSRPILILPTARSLQATIPTFEPARTVRAQLAAVSPQPFGLDRKAAGEQLATALEGTDAASVFWLTDGLDDGDAAAFATRLQTLAGSGGVTLVTPRQGSQPLGLRVGKSQEAGLAVEVVRLPDQPRAGSVLALSGRGQRLGEATFSLAAGATSVEAAFDLPLELRNQIARLEIAGERSAGAVGLLDTGSRWNRIGLLSGASREKAQPLLSPVHYLERALAPYAAIVKAEDSTSAAAADGLIAQNVTVLALADIGAIAGAPLGRLTAWIDKGGVLVRFAGPRLEEGGDTLLPVPLRLGGRSLGGALSWSTPQPLAPFDEDSPFAGLTAPEEVRINRQILADPALMSDDSKVWARLADGTPLVTAQKRGAGWLVLFHVTANSDWSNLPLSGLFVEMMQRIASLTGLGELSGRSATGGSVSTVGGTELLSPVETLDGYGVAGPPPALARPIARNAAAEAKAGPANPPGIYGTGGITRALNVIASRSVMTPLPPMPAGVTVASYRAGESTPLKSWCLAAAVGLLLLDVLAVLLLQSSLFGRRRAVTAATAALLAAIALHGVPGEARAQAASPPGTSNDAFALQASLKPRLAYVTTGDAAADETSRAGLVGLGLYLTTKTAFEPAEPMAVDVETDQLSFFPVLYWPVRPQARALSEAALNKIDAYMKSGGLIVFDTQDALDVMPSLDGSPRAGSLALQRLLGTLDLPRLEPAPPDHVMTKSFYLLPSFPGRYDNSPLWVEAEEGSETADATQPRKIDGVSTVMITGNDLAGAWAVDELGRPLFAVVPGGEEQREYAYRVGVNIVMYALTGNYKADQVHVPALLERLGQ